MKSSSGSRKAKTLTFLGRLLAFIVCAALSLTVILLPISTSVPAYIWVLLAVCRPCSDLPAFQDHPGLESDRNFTFRFAGGQLSGRGRLPGVCHDVPV